MSYWGGHLGEYLDAYVDGALEGCEAKKAAQHLVVCHMCRADVDAERHVLAKMRAVALDPGRHASLVAGLLALDEQPRVVAPRVCVAVVAPDAPAHYNARGRKIAMGALAALACCGAFVMSSQSMAPMRTAPARPGLTQESASERGANGRQIAVIAAQISVRTPAVNERAMRSGRIEP